MLFIIVELSSVVEIRIMMCRFHNIYKLKIMKQIYLFLLIIVGINASAQTNCNIGNFELTTEFTTNGTIGQNSNIGSLYSVENVGRVSALNVHFPDGGVLFKLYL